MTAKSEAAELKARQDAHDARLRDLVKALNELGVKAHRSVGHLVELDLDTAAALVTRLATTGENS